MTVKEKRRIIEQHVIQILRRQWGGNDGIHKIGLYERDKKETIYIFTPRR
jgi:hypothetical protein